MKKWMPWIAVAILAAWFCGGFESPKPKDGFDIASFGRLPVLLDGRIQPLDSVARNALLTMSGHSSVSNSIVSNGPSIQPSEWLLMTMTKPKLADTLKVFRVEHPDLAGLFGTNNSGKEFDYFSFNEMTNQMESLQAQARALLQSEVGKEDATRSRNGFQRDLMHLYNSLILYDRLKSSLEPETTRDFALELQIYQDSIGPGKTALQLTEKGKEANEEDLARINAFFQRYQELSKLAQPLLIPPAASEPRTAWVNMGDALLGSLRDGEISQPAKYYAAMAAAYQTNQAAEFNQAVVKYRVWLQENSLDSALAKGRHEFLFNQLEPFYKALVIYVVALLLGCAYWINLSQPFRRTGFALLGLAFVIHTIGLIYRMYLEGRPPVTNLYSSAIFIGWGACLLGMILERIYKGAIGLVVAGLIGFVTLIIAHHLSLAGDTMEMLQAVLDTNLWLSTHVVIEVSGYASMFVAGILAVIYVVRGFFTKSLSHHLAQSLARMVYGIVCFATLFSFVGTVLGGIWADQSWGRFWGWDPKENGALIIVLWNAIILHARWGGMIKERGLIAMALFGNIVTSFSWFGVNMLGIGLHSYGWMDKAFSWLVGFDISQAVLVVIALLPLRYWASFKSDHPTPPSAPNLPPVPAT